MTNHSNTQRGFHHLKAAWYGEACLKNADYLDQIMIGMYCDEGGTSGEFAIRWTELGGKITPRLEAFDDSWSALWMFADLLFKLKDLDSTDPTPEEICQLLKSLGIVDMTERKQK